MDAENEGVDLENEGVDNEIVPPKKKKIKYISYRILLTSTTMIKIGAPWDGTTWLLDIMPFTMSQRPMSTL